ncbi:MAG: hypothetical protein QOE58_1157 [Actinomycetota bacterium]|nr:hypothetical protein [Actinomycetota bacterium]
MEYRGHRDRQREHPGAQHDAADHAAQQVPQGTVILRQQRRGLFIGHLRNVRRTTRDDQNCPEGATGSGRSPGTGVATAW